MRGEKILLVIPKAELTGTQSRHLEERLAAPEHHHDNGPPTVWHTYNNGTLYAFAESPSALPIGIADASGPPHAVNAGWWVDQHHRAQGYGSALVDALANYLIAKGYTGVGGIRIDTHLGMYDRASRALRKRFRANFNVLRPSGC